jgi:hypothetical protein
MSTDIWEKLPQSACVSHMPILTNVYLKKIYIGQINFCNVVEKTLISKNSIKKTIKLKKIFYTYRLVLVNMLSAARASPNGYHGSPHVQSTVIP